MTTQRGFFAELLHRRVPQILGLYIGGVWVAIEIGGWLGEQFTIPERLPAYLFVFLVLLVPSVALIAWGHGAPGKDRTTKFEMVFVPLNVVIALAAVFAVPPQAPEQDIEFVAQPAAAEAKDPQAQSVRVLAFSFRNETAEDPDWLGYAFSVLLSEDMIRASNSFRVYSVVESPDRVEFLKRRGFDRAIREPTSIQAEMATRTGFEYFVSGAVRDTETPGRLSVSYSLMQTSDNEVVISGSTEFDRDDLLAGADAISAEIQEVLVEMIGADVAKRRDTLLTESLTESTEAFGLYVNAIAASTLDNDREQAEVLLGQAIELDPAFAEARANRARLYYLSGRNQDALAEIDETFRFDYRLSKSSQFMMQINRGVIERNPLRSIDVAKTWVTVQPNNEAAHAMLAQMLQVNSIDLELALESWDRVRQINPNALNSLLESAQIQRQRGLLDSAIEYIETYLESEPDSLSARLSLAQAQLDQGDFDNAFAEFERASYLDNQSISASLGVIRTLSQRGDYAQAEDRLSRLQQRKLTDQQLLEAATSASSLYRLKGQYSKAIAEMEAVDEVAQRLMNPLIYLLQVKAPFVAMSSYASSDVESVIAELDALREQAQPPWDSFLYWYDMTPYGLYDFADEYIASKEKAAPVLRNSPNANFQMMMLAADAQESLYKNDNERALELTNRAIELTGESLLNVIAADELTNILAGMYDVLRKAGEPERAIEGLLPLIDKFPGHALAHLRLAQAYEAAGDTTKSIDALEEALMIWQDADETFVYLLEAKALQERLGSDV